MDIKAIMEEPVFSQRDIDDETHVRHQLLVESLDELQKRIKDYNKTMDDETSKAYENLYDHIEHVIALEAYNYGRKR